MQEQIKVLICGGRNYNDKTFAFKFLDWFEKEFGIIAEVIEGGARGADSIGREWAESKNDRIKITTVNAEWEKYGKSAGYKRNWAMAELKPDVIIAFPGGLGTQMMMRIGEDKNIPICQTWLYDWNDVTGNFG